MACQVNSEKRCIVLYLLKNVGLIQMASLYMAYLQHISESFFEFQNQRKILFIRVYLVLRKNISLVLSH